MRSERGTRPYRLTLLFAIVSAAVIAAVACATWTVAGSQPGTNMSLAMGMVAIGAAGLWVLLVAVVAFADRRQLRANRRASGHAGEARVRARLADIGRIISSSLAIEEVFEPFVDRVKELISCEWIAINVVDRERGEAAPPRGVSRRSRNGEDGHEPEEHGLGEPPDAE